MSYKIHQIISEEQLKAAVKRIAIQINKDYKGIVKDNDTLIVIGLLKGAFVFMSDLVREIDLPIKIEFMSVSSYENETESSGEVRIQQDIDSSVENKYVLLVEDIIDTGRTFSAVIEMFKRRNAISVKTCAMLDKPSRRVVNNLNPDYYGFKIEDKFVVGYGLDYAQNHRNLKYIAEVIFS